MNTLKDYVNFRLTHADKVASAEAYPLTMEDCKKYKPMRDLKVYGNSVQDGTPTPETPIEIQSVGEPVTDETDANYGKYKIPVVIKGKNLANVRKAFKNFSDYTELEEDGRQCIRVKSNGGAYASFDFTFKENTLYTISFEFKCEYDRSGVSLHHDCPFAVYYTNGDIDYCSLKPIDGTWNKRTLTTDANKTVSHIKQFGFDYRVYDYIDINTFQIEEGTTATEYEPYIEPQTTSIYLTEPLRKVGDYADYIDFKENKVVRKCVKKYLSNYSWDATTLDITGLYTFWCADYNILPHFNNTGLNWVENMGMSNIFPVYTHAHYDTATLAILTHGYAKNIRINVPREYLTENSVSALMVWLEKYNPYMVRVLASPTEEPITCELPKLNAKTSIIEVDTNLVPSNIYGKYIKK